MRGILKYTSWGTLLCMKLMRSFRSGVESSVLELIKSSDMDVKNSFNLVATCSDDENVSLLTVISSGKILVDSPGLLADLRSFHMVFVSFELDIDSEK